MGLVHTDQLNAIFHHAGFSDSSQLNHPRAAHNLLGYKPDSTSFTTNSTSLSWIGGPTPTWSVRYALFKRHGNMNKEVMAEDKKRAGVAAAVVEGGGSKRQKKSQASKSTRINPLAVKVAGGS